MCEARHRLFMALWQRRPCLNTEQAFGLRRRRLALAVRQAMPAGEEIGLARLTLGMHDAAARPHQKDLALEQVGYRGEADMGMRSHIDTLADQEFCRSHLIEENEGSHHLLLCCR